MSETSEELRPKPVPSTSLVRRIGIYAAVALLVFLLGFIPMWVRGRSCATGLAGAERKLSLAQMRINLATAAIDARRGEYEPARQAASQFFTSLGAEADKGNDSVLTQAQRDGVRPLFAQRDDIITFLARSDPAAADRLSDLYVSYLKVIGG